MVQKILLSLGVKPNSLGYKYLCELIEIAITGERIFPLNKYGYRFIAEKYGCSINGVEKNIQNSINTAWLHGDSDVLYDFFGATISEKKGKPTNKHFICAVCERLGCALVL